MNDTPLLASRISAGFKPAVPAVVAVSVFAAGFGALLGFWLLGDWPTDRGLFDFRAATVGDALLLPTAAAILAGFLSRRPKLVGSEARVAALATVCGAAAGALTQALWLLDDNPELNWTLPRPHHFNAPGWWHAVFLVAMSAALAGLVAAAARRANAWGAQQRAVLVRSPWLALLVACGLTFAGLVAADNADAA